MKALRPRLAADVALTAAIAALSLLPAFDRAATSLRIIAGIYTLFVVLANTIVGPRARLVLDVTFALFLAGIAWFEIIPTGHYGREAAVYAAIGATVLVVALTSSAARRTPTAPVSIPG